MSEILKLNDIIEIIASDNDTFDKKIFVITFINNETVKIKNKIGTYTLELVVNEENKLMFKDDSIEEVNIIQRSNVNGYAAQNGLVEGTWIRIYFDGDFPLIVSGEIQNVEQDMIEIEVYEQDKVPYLIYIDFAYSGIPEELNIKKIEIADHPSSVVSKSSSKYTENTLGYDEEEDVAEVEEESKLSDFIEFEEDVVIQIPEKFQIFNLNQQIQDLFGSFINNIPVHKRTPDLIKQFQENIDKYVQLYKYHQHVKNGIGHKYNGTMYNYLTEWNTRMSHIIPVVSQTKKVYVHDDEDPEEIQDKFCNNALAYHDGDFDRELADAAHSFKPGSEYANSYNTYLKNVYDALKPYRGLENENTIHNIKPHVDIDCIVNNNNDFFDTFGYNKNEHCIDKPFFVQRVLSSETMNLVGFFMLGKKAVFSSRAFYPQTNIFDQANLNKNFIASSGFLRKKYSRINENTLLDKFKKIVNKDDRFDLESFIKLKQSLFIYDTNLYVTTKTADPFDKESYSQFVQKILLNGNWEKLSLQIIDFLNTYYRGEYTLVNILEFLAPYGIRSDNIKFKLFEKLNFHNRRKTKQFIAVLRKNNEELRKVRQENKSLMLRNLNAQYSIMKPLFLSYIEQKDKEISALTGVNPMGLIQDCYSASNRSSSELMFFLYNIDSAALFHNLSSMNSLRLYAGFLGYNWDKYQRQGFLKYLYALSKEKKDCGNIRIAKLYKNLDHLKSEDSKEVLYFDKEFDPTNYGFKNKFKTEEEIRNALKKTFLMDDDTIENEIKYINEGKRMVEENNYAVLDEPNKPLRYYKRVLNSWKYDENIVNIYQNDNGAMCNLQDSCFKIPNKYFDNTPVKDLCTSVKLSEVLLRKNMINEMIDSQDNFNVDNFEEYRDTLVAKTKKYVQFLDKQINLNLNRYIKYNDLKKRLALDLTEDEIKVSPYKELLDELLATQDLTKKYMYLKKFGLKFTREAQSVESVHWRYCVDTGVELCPSFLFEFGDSFLTDKSKYPEVVARYKSVNGVIDGDKYVCKHTGFVIEDLMLVDEERFDQEGFRIINHDVIDDLGEIDLDEEKEENNMTQYFKKLSYDFVHLLCHVLTIDLTHKYDEIVNYALLYFNTEKHRLENQGKKLSIKILHTLLAYSLIAYVVVYIQVTIPLVYGKRVLNGCKLHAKRVNNGVVSFPSSRRELIDYVLCAVMMIQRNNPNLKELWQVKVSGDTDNKKKSKLPSEVIYDIIVHHINELPNFKKKYEDVDSYKAKFKTDVNEELVIEETSWKQFKPPLFYVEEYTVQPLGNDFLKLLKSNIMSRKKEQFEQFEQFEQIDAIKTKIMQYSNNVIYKINKIVKTQTPLMKGKTYFTSNACCVTDGSGKVIDYFKKTDTRLQQNVDAASSYSRKLTELRNLSFAPFMFYGMSVVDESVSDNNNSFSKQNVYDFVVKKCNFNNTIPIPEVLSGFCAEKPRLNSYNPELELSKNILLLEENGQNYTVELLQEMAKAIGNKNKKPIKSVFISESPINQFRTYLKPEGVSNNEEDTENEEEKNTPPVQTHTLIDDKLIKTIYSTLDSYDVSHAEHDNDKLLNMVAGLNVDLKNKLKDFVKKKQNDKLGIFVMNLDTWKTIEENSFHDEDVGNYDTLSRVSQFVKTSIENILVKFPSFMKGHVTKNVSKFEIPKYWNLSQNHVSKLKEVLSISLEPISTIYEDVKFNGELIEKLSAGYEELIEFQNLIPNYQPVVSNNDILKPAINSEIFIQLQTYALLKAFDIYLMYDTYLENKPNHGKNQDQLQKICRAYLSILAVNKANVDVTYDSIMENVRNIEEREKKSKTDMLKNLTIEMRQAENMQKNLKLGEWNVALRKGFSTYDPNFFDDALNGRDFAEEIREEQDNLFGDEMEQHDEGNMQIYDDDEGDDESYYND